MTTTVLTFDANGHATHPYAKDSSGNSVIVNGTPGDQLVVFQLPFGSFTPGQTPATITFDAHVSNLANLNVPLNVKADGGFQYGNDPLDNPTVDPTIIGATQTDAVTPTLVHLTKIYLGPEDETATGPNYPRQYEIDASIAPGQTLTNFALSDVLPGNIQFQSVQSVSGNGSSTITPTLPGTSTPGGTLTETFDKLVGTGGPTDAKLVYNFFVPRDPSGSDGTNTPDLPSGGFTPSPNTATGSGSWTPLTRATRRLRPRPPAIPSPSPRSRWPFRRASPTSPAAIPPTPSRWPTPSSTASTSRCPTTSPSRTWSPPTPSPMANCSMAPSLRP